MLVWCRVIALEEELLCQAQLNVDQEVIIAELTRLQAAQGLPHPELPAFHNLTYMLTTLHGCRVIALEEELLCQAQLNVDQEAIIAELTRRLQAAQGSPGASIRASMKASIRGRQSLGSSRKKGAVGRHPTLDASGRIIATPPASKSPPPALKSPIR